MGSDIFPNVFYDDSINAIVAVDYNCLAGNCKVIQQGLEMLFLAIISIYLVLEQYRKELDNIHLKNFEKFPRMNSVANNHEVAFAIWLAKVQRIHK